MAVLVKTLNGLAYASVKSRDGLAVGSISRINGLDVTSGGGFVPTDITGCKLWLPADYITGLSNGDPVALWEDQSTEGNDAAQASGGDQPEYVTGVVNSLPVVRFNGSSDYMDGIASLGISQPFTVFGVFSIRSLSSSCAFFDCYGGNRALLAASASSIEMWAGNDFSNAQSYTPGSTGFIVLKAVYNGASSESYKNGGSPVTGNPGSNAAGSYTLARWQDLGTRCAVDWADLAVFDGLLDSVESDQLWSYFGTKYDIPIT